MNIGFGTTVLEAGKAKGRLDGIGVYTQAILNELEKTNYTMHPLKFSSIKGAISDKRLSNKNLPYAIHSGLSSIFNTPIGDFSQYEKRIDFFFAPDHHIPHFKTVPVIATVMDIIPYIHPEWVPKRLRAFKNFAFKKSVLSAEHIITISEYSKQDIMKYFHIPDHTISVVPLGVDSRYFSRISSTNKQFVLNKFNINKNFFLFVGTLQPRKNIIRIIEAYEQLPTKIRDTNMLVIVGQNGWETNELLEKIEVLEKTGQGKWLNYIEDHDMLALLQSSIGLVYPSLYEGFGLPIIEAFASRCPVISSNTTSIPEVAGDAALLVNPLAVDEIANAMQILATDVHLRDELVKKGGERAKEFTWEKSAEEHMRVFKKVLRS